MENNLLTLTEAAEILRVHPRTITRWSQAGLIRLIPLLKGYRIERAELDRFKAESDHMAAKIMREA